MSKNYDISFEDFMNIDFNVTIDSTTKSTLNISAELLQYLVGEFVPVETGELRESFEIVESKNKRVLGSALDYAPVVEHGSRNRKGIHFLEKALDNYTEEDAQKIISGLFEDMLEIDLKG